MHFAPKPMALAITLALTVMTQAALAQSNSDGVSGAPKVLPEAVVNATKIPAQEVASTSLTAAQIAVARVASSDTASLLKDIPGVSINGAGGVSSLPAIHGMADDRIRIKVDGMDLISACANHMNSPLSYIDPSKVASIKVFTGVAPVSVGGDSIAGTIQVNSAAPQFAKAGEGILLKGEAGTFYRSNGNAHGANLSATLANEKLSVRYTGSSTQAENYTAAKDFKPAAQSLGTSSFIKGDEVASSSYKSENHSIALALRHEQHLLELQLGLQRLPYQGFPNQRMDMTDNDSRQANLHYVGQYLWGSLDARIYKENTRHKMNFLQDKMGVGSKGMPMDTEGKTSGAKIKADLSLSERDTLSVGAEYQHSRLDDWWDPVAPSGGMGGGTFININNGQRDRSDIFAEWSAVWSTQWQSQLGIRSSSMSMNADTVKGYNPVNYPPASYAAFNAADRNKTDHNLDLTASLRFLPSAEMTIEGAYARKTRSPNLYERFAWSTNNKMVMNMVNWSGDANGYVGNLDLKPETANTLSATASWHDASNEVWKLSMTPYFTHVENFIDAARCPIAAGTPCTVVNRDAKNGFVYLQFVNQSARLYGADISGFATLAKDTQLGSFTASGLLNYTKGKNQTSGEHLYNIMPLNAKLALTQTLGNWSNTIETQFVDAKTHTSQVRNELATSGYSLLNLRSTYQWKQYRLDVGVDNALNKFYASPTSGAYVGQRPMNYGMPVPGIGRSLYLALSVAL